jgi:dTMP kinase
MKKNEKVKNAGFLISFEGGEGGGKTTQIATLREQLIRENKDVLVLREPGGTRISEQIREVILSTKNVEIEFVTEVLLLQAARAQTYGELVLPALAQGKIVLMDRSRDSSVVYQGVVRGFGVKFIEQLNNISTNNTYPNLTFLLDVEVKTGLQRKEIAKELNRLDLEASGFHEKVRLAYLNLAKKDNSKARRWKIIDANQDVSIVAQEIWKSVKKVMSIK